MKSAAVTASSLSSPEISVETAVLSCLGDMLALDVGRVVQVSDSAGHLQHAVMGAGGQAKLSDSHFKGALAGNIQRAERADLGVGMREL